MSKTVKSEEIVPHKILREVLRHYLEYQDLVSYQGGDSVIEYKGIKISFWDLKDTLKPQNQGGLLSDRKREAIFWNVILDKTQQEAADIMGITTVSVGQYVEQGCIQLAKKYFAENE